MADLYYNSVLCLIVQCEMAAKSSGDDPMDLGPFLQNYVMKNPFKVQQESTVDSPGAGNGAGGGRCTPRWRGSWPRRVTAALRARRRGDKASMLNGSDNNDDVDVSTDLLLHNIDETSRQGDVTAWYVDSGTCPAILRRWLCCLSTYVYRISPHTLC